MNTHNPDVLSCLANLSNDEVFTPPEVANRMLDLLPARLWSDPTATFLDPCAKSGVFLREIVKRLINSLASVFPDVQERIDHILHHQVYGLAITELTALVSRRSVYCTKDPSGAYSISAFDTPEGNVRFRATQHTWDSNGRCTCCGASREVYDRGPEAETHAYEFIHTDNPNNIYPNMQFDVIIGNPPYHLDDGGNGASAKPIYHLFVNQAKKLQPAYLIMIIPARWYSGGKGLDEFRDEMLNDTKIKHLEDFFDSQECFPGIDLSGGVCYFLRDNNYDGECTVVAHRNGEVSSVSRSLLEQDYDTFIRFNEAVTILRKIREKEPFKSFKTVVSSRKPFGLETTVKNQQEPLC